jgi:uncharacterized protein (TIGR02594 family)
MIPARFSYLKTANCPPWLVNALHEVEHGVMEVPGNKSNPRILAYRDMAHIALGGDDGDVPWCAIAVNAMLETAGVKGTRNAMARGFLSNDNFTPLNAPTLGAITVLSSNRGASSGHVGFYIYEDDLMVYLCGGNQNDQWSIAPFPKSRILGYRFPKGKVVAKSVAKPAAKPVVSSQVLPSTGVDLHSPPPLTPLKPAVHVRQGGRLRVVKPTDVPSDA